MKIKMLQAVGDLEVGKIYDAGVNSEGNVATCYGPAGTGWYLANTSGYPAQFEIVDELQNILPGKIMLDDAQPTNAYISKFAGENVRKVTIEFFEKH